MNKKTQKGYCRRMRKFYGFIKVTDKGQIAIPKDLREDLGIKTGNKLFVLKRKDGRGFNLIKEEVMDEFVKNISD